METGKHSATLTSQFHLFRTYQLPLPTVPTCCAFNFDRNTKLRSELALSVSQLRHRKHIGCCVPARHSQFFCPKFIRLKFELRQQSRWIPRVPAKAVIQSDIITALSTAPSLSVHRGNFYSNTLSVPGAGFHYHSRLITLPQHLNNGSFHTQQFQP